MINLKRHPQNPILSPNLKNDWEAQATFNGCVVKQKGQYHLFYRAMSLPRSYHGLNFSLSSVGQAVSDDGINFKNRRQVIKPEQNWEIFGCEDPRVTKLEDKYFIFYTVLSSWPPTPLGIKIGVMISKDLKNFREKHLVTHFNSKAMALFPERINGEIVGILTVNTDLPPAKVALAFFDREEQIWSADFWKDWLARLDDYVVPLPKKANDHFEVGAPPLKTEAGWLLLYSYIKNYFNPPPVFGIEAVLLDLKNPLKIKGRTVGPLLLPKKDYEQSGQVNNIVFPSGVLVENGQLLVYYGAADTYCCLASCNLKSLLNKMI